jgi:uncharacterized protein (TIGR02147 family)
MELSAYQLFLNQELARRCEKNPHYSLRAFARAMGIDAGTVSRYLNGKQIPSFKLSQRILGILDLQPREKEEFLHSLARSQNAKTSKERLIEIAVKQKPDPLDIEYYRVITDWYHAALMELTYVDGFRGSPRWIAKKLGIGQSEAQLAIKRLIKLGLLEKKNGKLVKTNEQLFTKDRHLTTSGLRKNQRQFLEKAIFSLENDAIEKRKVTSMTMAIDPKKLEIAKRMIDEFSLRICKVLESGNRKIVYNLQMALYPIQKNDSERT